MVTLRRLRRRIRSVDNIQQITRAMEMVAASRLKKAMYQLVPYRAYAYKMQEIFEHLGNLTKLTNHPFWQKRTVHNTLVIIVTSSRGLCGAYNTNLIKTANAFLNKFNHDKIKIITIGKKGYQRYKQNYEIVYSLLEFDINIDKQKIKEIYTKAEDLFIGQIVDEVYLIYPKFISRLGYEPRIEKILSLESSASEKAIEYIVEPDAENFLKLFLPQYIISRLNLYLFESLASEYSARTIAMKTATDNADTLLDELTRLRNKVRQAGITKEILEIVAAAGALR